MLPQTPDWIKEGLYVDAKDKYGDWQAGLILTLTKTHLKIRFDGWSAKIDQIYNLGNQRVKPFRSMTRGYTGQKKSPGIREHWQFTLDNLEQRLSQFRNFTEHLQQKSGFQINQYLRGQNYFYVDFLLSQTCSNFETIKKVYDYFKANFQLVKTYFDHFLERDTKLWFQAGENKDELTPRKVYAELYHELFDSVSTIIGANTRCQQFFKYNQKILKELYANQGNFDIFIARELSNIHFIGSFDNVIVKVYTEAKEGNRTTPLVFINALYSLFVSLDKLPLHTQFKKKVNLNLLTIVQEYLNTMTIQDAKTNEKIIEDLLSRTKFMCNKLHSEKQEVCKWVEKTRMKLSLYLIQSDVLQKKLRGINGLKEFYEGINRKLINPYENISTLCTKTQFREWMDQQNLIKIIFETNEHSEVIKKGCEMVLHFYACRHKVCTIEDIVYIWETCFNKHEAIKRIVYGFWKDLATHVVGENDFRLFIGVIIKNEEKINEDWEIESLFGFLHALKSDDSNESITDLIRLMYRKTLSNQKFIQELAKELSYFQSGSKVLQSTVNHCLEQISQKVESIFHLKLLAKLYSQLHEYKTYIPENTIKVLIEQLQQFMKQQVSDKLFQTVFNLINEIMMAKDGGVSSGNPKGVKLTYENFETLWEIFSQCQNAQFRKMFFSWIVPRSYNQVYNLTTYQINHRFSHQFRLEIFSNIICDQTKLNYSRMDIHQFAVFKEFFIYANAKAGVLESRTQALGTSSQQMSRRIIRTKSKDIQGLRELWEIFKNCENEELVVSSSVFLRDLYLRVSVSMPLQERAQRTRSLMEMIQNSIGQGERTNNFSLIKRVLILLSKLIAQIKQRVQTVKQEKPSARSEKQTITIYMSTSDAQQIQISVEDTMLAIKTEIGRKYHLSREEFALYCGKYQVAKQLYDLPYYMMRFDEASFKIVKVSTDTGKYIHASILQNLYQKIIAFLRNQHLCLEAFMLLEHLEVYEPARLFDTLSKDIQDKDQIVKNKKKIYLHIFFTKLFVIVLDKEISPIDNNVLLKLISHLQIPPDSSLIVTYLTKIVQILSKHYKKQSSTSNSQNPQQTDPAVTLNVYRPKLYILLLNLLKYINSSLHFITNVEVNLFNAALNLYTTGFESNKLLFDSFIKDDHFREFMFEVFIKCEVLQVKKVIQKKLSLWLKDGFCSINEERKVAQFFINELYYAIYNKNLQKPITGAEFTGIFKLFRTIIETISFQTLKEITHESQCPVEQAPEGRLISFTSHIFNAISNQSDTQTSPNFMLNGQLQILVGMIKRDRSFIDQSFVDYLFYQCLIYVHGKTQRMEVKCLFKENITLVLEVLWYAMVNIQTQEGDFGNPSVNLLSLDKFVEVILKRFREFHYTDEWRSVREWSTEYPELSRAKNDFVGLENPGCICYLNSLLQQLYMIEEFRTAILNMKTERSATEEIEIDAPEEDSPELILKLKYLFLNLMYSERSAIDPQFFTSSIKTTGNRPMVKIFEQMDIDEFSMILFDKIESKIHRYKEPNFIRELFGGTYSNEIISQECTHSSEREQQFLSISLDVKKHITQSFQSLVKGQMLEGQNSYFCDGCQKKVKALKRLSIKRLPRQLIISLRRFEFDYEADQKIKINKYCEFPFQLNLEGYSQDKLNQLSAGGKKQEGTNNQRSSTSMNEQEPVEAQSKPKNNYPPEYFQYKLKGVVVHTGSADSGHYYSFIESKDGNWFEFNDDRVSEFDVKNLPQEAFGGKDGEYARIRNAYLLFYERKDKRSFKEFGVKQEGNQNDSQQQMNIEGMGNNNEYTQSQSVHPHRMSMQQIALTSLMNPVVNQQIQQNRRFIEQIILQNKKIRLWHFFFSKEYMEFVFSFVRQALYPIFSIRTNELFRQSAEYHCLLPSDFVSKLQIRRNSSQLIDDNAEHEIFRFLVSYTFLIQIRQKNTNATLDLLETIMKLFFQHPDQQKRFTFIDVFLNELSQQSFFDEFFVNCPYKDKSRMVGNFIFQTLKRYLLIYSALDHQPMPKTVKTILKLIMRTVIKVNANLSQLLVILKKLLTLKHLYPKMAQEIIAFILKKDFVTVLIDNGLGIDTPKQIRAKRIQNLQNDISNPIQNPPKPQQNQPQRKDSDVSAKDQEDGSPTKKKHLNQKLEIQGQEEKTLDTIRYSVLFGQYSEETGNAGKVFDKEAWTILYEVQQEMKANKNKIQEIKDQISSIKKMPVVKQETKPAVLLPQPPKTKPPSPENRGITVEIEPRGTDEEGSEMEEESSEHDSWNEESESSLNEEEMRQAQEIGEGIGMENQVSDVVHKVNESETGHAGQISAVNVNNQESANSFGKKVQQQNSEIKQQLQAQPQPQQSAHSLIPQASLLSPQDQQKLQQLQSLLSQTEKEYADMEYRFYLPLNKLKHEKIMKIVSEQKDSKSMISLAAFISEMVFNNVTFNDTVLFAIETAFKDYESSKYRPFFIVVQKLLEIEDDLARKRRFHMLSLFRTSFRHNDKYFLECDFMQQFILRYAARIPAFEQILKESPSFLGEMKNWIAQKKSPSSDIVKKHRMPNCERLMFRLHGVLVSGDMKDYETLSGIKFDAFEKLKQNRFTPIIASYPDLPKPCETYQKGDFVDAYFDFNTWVHGLVEECYFGYLFIKFINPNNKAEYNMVHEDDQKIRLYKKKVKLEERSGEKMEIEK